MNSNAILLVFFLITIADPYILNKFVELPILYIEYTDLYLLWMKATLMTHSHMNKYKVRAYLHF